MMNFFGYMQIPLSDSLKLPAEYLSDEFYINFMTDTTYKYENKFGKVINGRYERKNDSLKLKEQKESYDWINFKIDSLSIDRLCLSRDEYTVRYFIDSDTITIRTGSRIKIILHKENIQ